MSEEAKKHSLLAPLEDPTFRGLWVATMSSNLGGLIQAVGAGWMMTTITNSRDMVALVQASSTLPIMLFSIVAGALADSIDRRRIMLTAQTFMLSVSAALAAFAFMGLLSPWLLLTFTFLIGCGMALNNPSWQASMGDIVRRDQLPTAVSLNSMSFNLMRSVGPAVGGTIVQVAGAAVAFTVNACSYVLLIFALLRWQPKTVPSALPREAVGPAISAGLRYIVMSPNLMKVMFRGFMFGGSAVAVLALLPLVARDLVDGDALTYGFLLGAFGFGAIGGAVLNSHLRARFKNEIVVRGAFLTFALTALLLGLSRQIWLSCFILMFSGACWVLVMSLFNVTVQLSTPRWVVGRALSIYQTATFGGMAGGSWLWGGTAQAYGSATALIVSACVMVVGALAGLKWPLPEFSALNLDPLGRFTEPQLRLDLRMRSGPIMVMVDYEIDQEDVPAFLEAMAERRRVRKRDGARQWALLRDLENPDIWTESYHVPTWVEYVRHNQRRTQADAEISDKLRALHRGGEIRVHRMIERQAVPRHDDTPLKPHLDVHH
ncbi:MAG: MFS transporter [Pseudomonadota bacterium]